MYRWEMIRAITEQRVFGIVRGDSAKESEAAAATMLDSGLKAVEITMTTPRALDTLARLADTRPGALLGAGTVLDDAAARAAIDVGARFLVSPALNREVIRAGNRYGVPVIPGVTTPSEMMWALEHGADALKLFPARDIRPQWLTDVHAALPQAPIIPTGGITLESAPDWIAAGALACGIGSTLTVKGPEIARQRIADLLKRLEACADRPA